MEKFKFFRCMAGVCILALCLLLFGTIGYAQGESLISSGAAGYQDGEVVPLEEAGAEEELEKPEDLAGNTDELEDPAGNTDHTEDIADNSVRPEEVGENPTQPEESAETSDRTEESAETPDRQETSAGTPDRQETSVGTPDKSEVSATPSTAQQESEDGSRSPATDSNATPSDAANATIATDSDAIELINDLPQMFFRSGSMAAPVSSLEELEEAVQSSEEILFTNDITIPAETMFYYDAIAPLSKKVVIDTGEYSLIVAGVLWMDGFAEVTFKGHGGEQGVIRVLENGTAIVNAEVIPDSGYSIYQEDGAHLETGRLIDRESVHFSQYAVLGTPKSYSRNRSIVTLVQPGETVEGCFLRDGLDMAKVEVNYQGISRDEDQVPVVWDFDTPAEELEEQYRTAVWGDYQVSGYPKVWYSKREKRIVVFRTRPVVFLDVNVNVIQRKFRPPYAIIFGNFTLPPYAAAITFQSSFDGEEWYDEDKLVSLTSGRKSSETDNFTIILPDVQSRSFRLMVEKEDGTKEYSDVVKMEDEEIKAIHDFDGNRGGGTEVLPGLTDREQGHPGVAGNSDDGNSEWETHQVPSVRESLPAEKQEETETAGLPDAETEDGKDRDSIQAVVESPKAEAGNMRGANAGGYGTGYTGWEGEGATDGPGWLDEKTPELLDMTGQEPGETREGMDGQMAAPSQVPGKATVKEADSTTGFSLPPTAQAAAGGAAVVGILAFSIWGHPLTWLAKLLVRLKL